MPTRVQFLKGLLSVGFQKTTEMTTRIHNVFLVSEDESLLTVANNANDNLGLQLWGYLTFKDFLDKKAGKLKIPKEVRQIKIDVGLSVAAPNSALWLENLPGRMVFGFEPNPENVQELLTSDKWKRSEAYHYLDLKYLNDRFVLFNAAIDDCPPQLKTFYMTAGDPGTSSLYEPNIFKIKEKITVPCIRLSDFLAFIPWNRFKYIEHIKVDTQGNDLRVLQSAGDYLSEQVVFVTAEIGAKGYSYSHSASELDKFMKGEGFEFIENTNIGGNKTYVNRKYKKLLGVLDYSTENR